MKKSKIIKIVKEKSGANTSVEVEKILKAYHELIAESIMNKEEFSIDGIGKLKSTERAARKGRNPKTGEEIEISASNGVKFVLASNLKKELNS